MKLWHATWAAPEILANGFRDSRSLQLGPEDPKPRYEIVVGVWVSDMPTPALGRMGDYLTIQIPEERIAIFERATGDCGWREWLIPAELLNHYPVEFAGTAAEILFPTGLHGDHEEYPWSLLPTGGIDKDRPSPTSWEWCGDRMCWRCLCLTREQALSKNLIPFIQEVERRPSAERAV